MGQRSYNKYYQEMGSNVNEEIMRGQQTGEAQRDGHV